MGKVTICKNCKYVARFPDNNDNKKTLHWECWRFPPTVASVGDHVCHGKVDAANFCYEYKEAT